MASEPETPPNTDPSPEIVTLNRLLLRVVLCLEMMFDGRFQRAERLLVEYLLKVLRLMVARLPWQVRRRFFDEELLTDVADALLLRWRYRGLCWLSRCYLWEAIRSCLTTIRRRSQSLGCGGADHLAQAILDGHGQPGVRLMGRELEDRIRASLDREIDRQLFDVWIDNAFEPLRVIAAEMGYSVPWVHNRKNFLRKRMREYGITEPDDFVEALNLTRQMTPAPEVSGTDESNDLQNSEPGTPWVRASELFAGEADLLALVQAVQDGQGEEAMLGRLFGFAGAISNEYLGLSTCAQENLFADVRSRLEEYAETWRTEKSARSFYERLQSGQDTPKDALNEEQGNKEYWDVDEDWNLTSRLYQAARPVAPMEAVAFEDLPAHLNVAGEKVCELVLRLRAVSNRSRRRAASRKPSPDAAS